MKYTPKHSDIIMRTIYGGNIACALVMMMLGTGLVRTILLSFSVVLLAVGLFLFIRHDLTSFTYIVMENEKRLDFYVDRAVGKRGAYACYYPLSDAVLIEKYEKGTKKRLYSEYGKVFVYNYCHNRFTKDKYIVMFRNDGYFDAVVIELDTGCYEYLKKGIEASKREQE
ncbi:MAG: hypothetical protein IJX02_01195 [Clostridia bacterium]|nr:hypothetical protein [Clostridia bacterium]